ncbi:hypothetical protein VNO80_11534 [Phaseolus coccineus]|uniref:Uncharacterized protein n=1 Tax=Phaseolus coccineus TaxID=3886 RepID=A0AAN9NAE5_PHACN
MVTRMGIDGHPSSQSSQEVEMLNVEIFSILGQGLPDFGYQTIESYLLDKCYGARSLVGLSTFTKKEGKNSGDNNKERKKRNETKRHTGYTQTKTRSFTASTDLIITPIFYYLGCSKPTTPPGVSPFRTSLFGSFFFLTKR